MYVYKSTRIIFLIEFEEAQGCMNQDFISYLYILFGIPLVALIFIKADVYKGFSNSLKPLKLVKQGEYMSRRRCLSSNKTGNF